MAGKACKYLKITLVRFVLMTVLTGAIIAGCEPYEEVSEVPEITFKNFDLYIIDTLSNTIFAGKLVFDFIDGDADIGVNVNSYSVEDSINFFLIPSYKENNLYYPLEDTLKYQIRHNEKLDRTGKYKTIKGEISLMIYYFITPAYDTIRYDFYIMDRAGNKSNTATTSDIWFR